jgi:hypothetical protein
MENWKKIKGTENYEVSTLGRIKNSINGRLIGSKGFDEYMHATIKIDGIVRNKRIHSLVWQAFGKGIPSRRMVVDHKDRNRSNNNIENLQLISFRANVHKDTETITGVVGVHWNSVKKRFVAVIMLSGIRYKLGARKTINEAKKLYDEALKSFEIHNLTPNDVKEKLSDNEKRCSGCHKILDTINFDEYKTSNGHISKRAKCKICYKEYRKFHDNKYRNK